MNTFRSIGALVLILGVAASCAPPRMAMRPLRYEVDVRLDPAEHTLVGQATVQLERIDTSPAPRRRGLVELELHPDLVVESVVAEGATLLSRKARRGRADDDADVTPTAHRLVLQEPEDRIRLVLDYNGKLFQDVAGGEEEGKVHNFAVSAHVSEEGVYLDGGGHWYPSVELPEDADPAHALADYTLSTDTLDGFELVAGLERDGDQADGRLHWRSRYPVDGMVLLGGPLERWSRQHGDVRLHAVLAPDKEGVAADILTASAEYLDRYEPLIGAYPFSEFTVLEAFFSSGFAFPTCTQIVGSQLSERRQYRRHGYLDHELLHNWWGNGIYVDEHDGNWCEGLASYMGNYYGHVLDGDEEGARKQRRNHSNMLSAIDQEKDKPLGTFGLDDGAGRGIGYMKGAAVFHMLERKVGADELFAALRRLTAERMGKITGWDHIREAVEIESGTDLGWFFDQWVRGGGAPTLDLMAADRRPGADGLALTISQGETDFALDVPLRLHYGDRTVDVVAFVDRPVAEAVVPCETAGLTAVELDPDYHVFRKLKPEETMPTSSLTKRGERLLVVLPEGELSEAYQRVVDSFTRAVLGDEDEPKKGHEVAVRKAGGVGADDLDDTSVLVVGNAVHHPAVRAFLERTRAPVSWLNGAFVIEEEEYAGAGQAVFLTVHHPERAENGVTVYYGNSTAALANSRLLSYYPNSLLVFETPLGEAEETGGHPGMPPTRVVRRIDFEFHDRIDF